MWSPGIVTEARPRSTVTGLHWPALPDSVGASLLAVHYQLAQSEWWPAGQLAAASADQLAALLRHARDTVPAYAQRLAGLPLDDPQALMGAWHELPLLRRADVQALGRSCTAAPCQPTTGRSSSTTPPVPLAGL